MYRFALTCQHFEALPVVTSRNSMPSVAPKTHVQDMEVYPSFRRTLRVRLDECLSRAIKFCTPFDGPPTMSHLHIYVSPHLAFQPLHSLGYNRLRLCPRYLMITPWDGHRTDAT